MWYLFCINIFWLVRNPIYSNFIHFDPFWTDLILSDLKIFYFHTFLVTTRMTVTLMKSAKFHRKPMEMLIQILIVRNFSWMAHQKPRYLVQTNYFCFGFAWIPCHLNTYTDSVSTTALIIIILKRDFFLKVVPFKTSANFTRFWHSRRHFFFY